MKVAIFDTHRFEKEFFEKANINFQEALTFFEPRLTEQTAKLAAGFDVVCSFANDRLNSKTLSILNSYSIRLIALRSAGFNHVDLEAAAQLGMKVVRVPEYSPYAVAEHATALILSLNRKIHHAYNRVREGNFSLDSLVGFDLHGKTVGIIGTGKIGSVMARIMSGFGCQILAFDIRPKIELTEKYNVKYTSLEDIYHQSDIISLHVPLTPDTKHLIDEKAIAQMKRGVMVINTGRGALVDARALIVALKGKTIGSAGLDVYEEEEGVFFQDLSDQVLQDDVLARLMTFPNVLITSHQAFLTREALTGIATTTLKNIREFDEGRHLTNEVSIRGKGPAAHN